MANNKVKLQNANKRFEEILIPLMDSVNEAIATKLNTQSQIIDELEVALGIVTPTWLEFSGNEDFTLKIEDTSKH